MTNDVIFIACNINWYQEEQNTRKYCVEEKTNKQTQNNTSQDKMPSMFGTLIKIKSQMRKMRAASLRQRQIWTLLPAVELPF